MDDSLARGMAMVSTTSAGLASTKVFEDQNLLPLILNHLAAPIVERVVSGPVPDSLPNDHTKTVDIVKRLDVDVRRVKLRAALNTLPGLLRGMAALGAVCPVSIPKNFIELTRGFSDPPEALRGSCRRPACRRLSPADGGGRRGDSQPEPRP